MDCMVVIELCTCINGGRWLGVSVPVACACIHMFQRLVRSLLGLECILLHGAPVLRRLMALVPCRAPQGPTRSK